MYYSPWMANNCIMDTQEYKTARKKDYWYLFEMSGMILDWRPGFYIINLAYVVVMVINAVYTCACLIASIFKVDDLIDVCQYLNFVGLLFVSLSVLASLNFQRERTLETCAIGSTEFFDYGVSFSRSEEIEQYRKEGRRRMKILFMVIPPWLTIIALSLMMSGPIDAAFSYPKINATYVNGIYQMAPLKMYYLHPIDNEFIRWLTVLSQAACSGNTALVIGCADLIMFNAGQNVIIQLEILNLAVLDTDKRASKLYELKFGREPPSDPVDKTNDRPLMNIYGFCLKQIVDHHKIILRRAEVYHKIVNWPCGIVVVNGSIVVAMSLLSIMQGGGKPSVLVLSFFLIIAEVASIFMVCEIGQSITSQCERLFDSMYAFKWMDCSVEVNRAINIMKCRFRKPIIMTAGSLTPINRDTFGTMMNTAYSYINLVAASGKEDAD
uniref:Odorant receptor n=1 Tax=Apolygus lucorum TaxID=248454 RepID=A0A1Q1NIT2_APOLU|nr:olfactory receptor [Apolygus lucorum]